MRALYATLRLVWRPLTLLHLAFVWVIVSFLLQAVPDVSEVMPVLRALWHGTATPAMVTGLWLVLAIAPAGVGLIVAMNRIDLQHTTLSWHLPDVRRRLLTGTIVAALLPAAALAANASPAATVAAFALAFYSFLVPGFCFDAAGSRAARVLMALPFVAVVAHVHRHPAPLVGREGQRVLRLERKLARLGRQRIGHEPLLPGRRSAPQRRGEPR